MTIEDGAGREGTGPWLSSLADHDIRPTDRGALFNMEVMTQGGGPPPVFS